MLAKILDALQERGGSASVRELSAQLNVDEDALLGMLEFLVQKGRVHQEQWGGTCLIAEEGGVSSACRLCPLRSVCRVDDARLGVVYTVSPNYQPEAD